MDDFLKPGYQGPRPSAVRPGFIDWSGYRLPRAATFEWRDLVEVAHANGLRLSHDSLKKWRVWRFLPGPTAGGATTVGRGKGETWPRGAGWRTAWISRWQADSLSYDALRLAIWLWTPAFEQSRADDMRRSAITFLKQDERFHARIYDEFGEELLANPEISAYQAVVMAGDSGRGERRALLRWAGLAEDDPRFERNLPFLERLNLDEMQVRLDSVTTNELRSFIATFRAATAHQHELTVQEFWGNPTGLARIVIRELYRYLLAKDGEVAVETVTT
jgi:hypothetical protein